MLNRVLAALLQVPFGLMILVLVLCCAVLGVADVTRLFLLLASRNHCG